MSRRGSGFADGTIVISQQPVPTISFYQVNYRLNTTVTVLADSDSSVIIPVESNKALFIYDIYVSSPLSSWMMMELYSGGLGPYAPSGGYGYIERHFKGGLDFYEDVTLKIYNYGSSDADVLVHVNGFVIPSTFTYKWRQLHKQRVW